MTRQYSAEQRQRRNDADRARRDARRAAGYRSHERATAQHDPEDYSWPDADVRVGP